jgi:ArsR family transcriptional regulator, virulence genes transcriptional regulator
MSQLEVEKMSGMDLKGLDAKAEDAARFLKAIASGPRLLILCLLEDGEKSVGAIADSTGLRLPAVSQNLALLKAANVVDSRRDGTTVYYSLVSSEARTILGTLQERFCPPKT